MRAADTDSDALAARPAPADAKRASGALSLLVTAGVVIGSVVGVYTLLPNRWARRSAIDVHRQAAPRLELTAPSHAQLVGWSIGVLGDAPPWPEEKAEVSIAGARRVDGAVHAVYTVAGDRVSIVARRGAVGAGREVDAGTVAVTWRDGPWSIAAVGPRTSESRWRAALGR